MVEKGAFSELQPRSGFEMPTQLVATAPFGLARSQFHTSHRTDLEDEYEVPVQCLLTPGFWLLTPSFCLALFALPCAGGFEAAVDLLKGDVLDVSR